MYEDEKRFDLVVRLSGEQRNNVQDVQNLLMPTPKGTQIPLNQVADVQVTEGPNQIQREDAQRRIIVGFNVRGRDVQSMVKEFQQKVEQRLKLPPGYHVTYGGAFENLEAAKSRLSIAVPVALLLIFLMLYFAFRSLKQGLSFILLFRCLPWVAFFALAIRGMPFSISAGVGFIALFGVAVLNGIVLISEFNRLKKKAKMTLNKIIMEGTRHTASACAYDCICCFTWFFANGIKQWRWCGSTASTGHRSDRRVAGSNLAHVICVAGVIHHV